ncbi:MAG: hypothetical protein P0116_02775 [Candidatus Nitrosocosmicus sp.]|nr:hypothetical protein [Candidatus Nitrosocosmicus sp.]
MNLPFQQLKSPFLPDTPMKTSAPLITSTKFPLRLLGLLFFDISYLEVLILLLSSTLVLISSPPPLFLLLLL